jgi:hypothetical protein
VNTFGLITTRVKEEYSKPKQETNKMIKYYSVVIYWREAGFEQDYWTGEKQEWIVPAHSERQAKRRALAINDFTTRDYEADEYEIEIDGCDIMLLEYEEGMQDDWKRYQEWIQTKFVCVLCEKMDFFPKKSEVGQMCEDCYEVYSKIKSLATGE